VDADLQVFPGSADRRGRISSSTRILWTQTNTAQYWPTVNVSILFTRLSGLYETSNNSNFAYRISCNRSAMLVQCNEFQTLSFVKIKSADEHVRKIRRLARYLCFNSFL